VPAPRQAISLRSVVIGSARRDLDRDRWSHGAGVHGDRLVGEDRPQVVAAADDRVGAAGERGANGAGSVAQLDGFERPGRCRTRGLRSCSS
jgi:hypothetical protein